MIGLLIALVLLFGATGIVVAAFFLAQLQKVLVMQAQSSRNVLETNEPQAIETTNVLEGLRVATQINQDNPHPVFETLLKELLFSKDVADIVVLSEKDTTNIWSVENPPDLLIKGKVICNGYAEIYYEAEFSCSNRNGAICTLIEKPPHGDRPNNLALELIARIEKELKKIIDRDERRQAIRELKE